MQECPVCVSDYPDDGPEGIIPHILNFHKGSPEADWLAQFIVPRQEERVEE